MRIQKNQVCTSFFQLLSIRKRKQKQKQKQKQNQNQNQNKNKNKNKTKELHCKISRYQKENNLHKSETRFLRNKIKNTFFQRRNRARRAGCTAEFEAEIEKAFDERIDNEIHKINQICDNLQDDETLEVPELLVARGRSKTSVPVILSQVIPVVGHNLSGKRCRPYGTDSSSKRARCDSISTSSDSEPTSPDLESESDESSIDSDSESETESVTDLNIDTLSETVSLLDPNDFSNGYEIEGTWTAVPHPEVSTPMRVHAFSQVATQPAPEVQSEWEINTLPDDFDDLLSGLIA